MSKKLIEVSLPLDVINDASAYDKMPGIGAHPKGIHHWWARLPLPSARAMLFASLIDDPSSDIEKFPTEEKQELERKRLFEIIAKLCQKKIHLHQNIFRDAHQEILKHCGGRLPTILDPFAGGGSIPLEAMRLGLPVIASDLNPVAVTINKAMLELLPSVTNHQAINPESRIKPKIVYKNAKGLSEDLRYYGRVINEELKKKIGEYFPKIKYKDSENGRERESNVITWLWARTVKCPNPACGCEMPLARSFILSSKRKPSPFVKPIVKRSSDGNIISGYEVMMGEPEIKGTVNRTGATCIACNEPVKFDYIRAEGKLGRIGNALMCVVADDGRGKSFISPTQEQINAISNLPDIKLKPETNLPQKALGFRVQLYGYDQHWKLFTGRQLLGLITIQEEVETLIKGIEDLATPEYIKALKVFLILCVDRLADFNCSFSSWKPSGEQQMHLFTRQVVPMVWDFTEANILEPKAISWINAIDIAADAIDVTLTDISKASSVNQQNAANYTFSENNLLISTDPPYYDNIGYSDLSDFFYVWLRRGLEKQFPELLKTLLVPKMEELVASEDRYGGKESAKNHFEEGFKAAFGSFKKGLDPRFPLTVYYAFKQEEESDNNEVEDSISLTTGWETLLEGLISSGFQITATWPIKASQQWRMRAMGSNALASYIVMVCRVRDIDSSSISRRQYIQELKKELPAALKVLQHSNLAPVDLAQAALGPGMAIFSKYKNVLEQDGNNMKVRTALSMINQTLDEILTEQEGDFDPETRWAISWFEQNSYSQGVFGDADALARARNTAVNALAQSGIVSSGSGQVRIISRTELSSDWNPSDEDKIAIWKITQYLIKQLQEKGEVAAAVLYKKLGIKADVARELAYRLFTICEKKGWSQEAQAYNSLVLSWNLIISESFNIRDTKPQQGTLFE